MSGDDALGDEMHAPDRDPLALDQGTADRLLDGRLDPADAPPAYGAVARVLAAAAAPPRADELAGEAEALSRFAAGSQAAPAGRRARRGIARVVVATAAVLAVLSVSGIGFATGALPHGGAWLGRTVGSVVGTDRTREAPAADTPSATTTVPSSRAPGHGPVPATTPRATGPATPKGRLCDAWQNGKGKKLQAAAFQALAAAAGGADHIPAYCAALLATEDDQNQPGRDDQNQPGRPVDPGNGQGSGEDQGQGSGEADGRRGGKQPAGGQG